MAYGLKYELLCNSKKGNLHKLLIYEDGYVDTDIDRNVSKNAFRFFRYPGTFIKGTSVVFSIREEADFEFLPFFTSIPKKYFIELYTETTKIFVGYLNTRQYQAAYKPAPNNLSFTAHDGLGLLKDQYFTLTGRQDEFAIIRHCLTYLDYSIGYSIAIPIHETTHNTSLSPLEQTYHNCSIFEDMTCYEVLEKILERYDASITQQGCRWQIVSSIGKTSNRLFYTSAGVYESSESAPTVQYLDYPDDGGDCYPVNSILQHGLEPGGRRLNILHKYGLRSSMLENYNFKSFSSGAFSGWSEFDNNSFLSVYQQSDGEKYWAYLKGLEGPTDSGWISQSINVENVTGESFVFEIDVCPLVDYFIGGFTSTYNKTANVRITVLIDVGGTAHYLSTSGWTTTPTQMEFTLAASQVAGNGQWAEAPNFQKIQIITSEIPGDGELTIYLFPADTLLTDGIAYSDVKLYWLDTGSLYNSQVELTAEFNDSSEVMNLDDIELISADAPSTSNENKLYDNISFLDNTPPLTDSAVTTVWSIDGDGNSYSLIELLARVLASNNRSPRQTLSGVIRGSSLTWDCLIEHTYNSNRRFEIASGDYDMFEETWNVKLIEVFAYALQDVTLTPAETYVSSGTGATGGGVSSGTVAHTHDDLQPLDADLAAIAALSGDGMLKKTSGTWGMDTTGYQPADAILTGITTGLSGHSGGPHFVTLEGPSTWSTIDNANLTSLGALSYSSLSFVKMTAAGTFALDTEVYLKDLNGVSEGYLPVITSTGQLQESAYAPTDFASSTHNHDASYQPLDSDLTAIAALSGDGILKKTSGTWGMDTTGYQPADAILTGITTGLAAHSGGPHVVTLEGASTFAVDTTGYQAAHANLTSLAALSYTAAAFVKMTAANTFSLDTDSYIPTISGSFTGYLPTITAGGELIASAYQPTDFASSTHNHDADYADISHNHSGTYEPALGSSSTAYLLQSSATTRSWVSKNSIYTAFQSLSDGATITWNMANGYNAKVTLGGNRTLSITNVADGMSGCLIVTQDGTGSRTLTLPSGSVVIGGGTFSLSSGANDVDILTFVYTGTTYYWSIGKDYLGPS